MFLIKILLFVTLLFSFAFSKGEVSKIFAHKEAATSTTYTADGHQHEWGQGENLIIDGFEYNNHHYNYVSDAPIVKIRRVDNNNSSGEPCGLFAEKFNGNNYHLAPSFPNTNGNCDMAEVMGGRIINVGALDLFRNVGYTAKNVERVDFISPQGITAPSNASDLSKAGHVVTEKSGNNYLQIAAILSIDANNNPTSFGSLVMVHKNYDDSSKIRYGLTNIYLPDNSSIYNQDLGFYVDNTSVNQGKPWWIENSTEPLGMAFVTLEDLGLSAGQKYYGFAYFGRDVSTANDVLTDITTYPRDTGGDTADPYGGVASYFVDEDVAIPFTCNSDSYINYVTSGSFATGEEHLANISLIDGTQTSDAKVNNVIGVTSLGYNVKDNYLWGFNMGLKKIARIDSNYNATTYNVAGLQDEYYSGGDVSSSGVLHLSVNKNVYKSYANRSKIARIDLNGNTPTKLQDMTLDTSIDALDIAFNPTDNNIYFITSTGLFYRIAVSANGLTGTVEYVGNTNLGSIYNVISYFDADGNFYFNSNSTNIYQLKFTNNTINSVTPFSTLTTPLTQGDGARCADAQVIKSTPPTLSISNEEVTEGNTNTTNLVFTLTLSKPAIDAITFDYTIVDKNTAVTEDYIYDTNRTISIAKGASTGSITIKVKGDTKVEEDESFTLNLSNVSNAIFAKSSAIGTIINDDNIEQTPFTCTDTFYLSNQHNLETGSTNTDKNWLHTINRTTQPYSFKSIGDGFTSQNGGYNAIGYRVQDNFIYGMYGKVLVKIDRNGKVQELGEVQGFNGGQRYTGEFDRDGYYYVTGTGGNDNTMYKIDVTQRKVIKTITLSSAVRFWDMAIDASGEYFYAMLITDGDADSTFNNDKIAKIKISDGTITTIGNSHSDLPSYIGLVFSDIDGDVFMMSNENGFYKVNTLTGELELLSSTNDLTYYNDGTSCPNANIVEPPRIYISDSNVTEGDINTTTNLTFTVALDQIPTINVSFDYQVFDGNSTTEANATSPSDYLNSGSVEHVVLSANTQTYDINITVKGDTEVEPDEIFNIVISNVQGAVIGNASAVGTIVNDDSDLNISNLIAEYRFDACSWGGIIGEVVDSSINNNNLTPIANVQTQANGKIFRALDINSSNQKVQGDTNITFENEVTVNAWIKTSKNQAIGGNYTRIVEFSKAGNSSYSTDLAYMPDGKTVRGWTSNESNTRSTEVRYDLETNGFHDGKWHLLSYTYDHGVATLYVDGVAKQTKTKDIGNIADPKKISIGGYYPNASHRFTGAIDEVTIFDKALTVEEINLLKNNSGLNRNQPDCENLHFIEGTTFQDENRNDIFDANVDVSLKNISVKLFKDNNKNGTYEITDTLITTKESDINGKFRFVNLPVDDYLIIVDKNDSDVPHRYSLSTPEVLSFALQTNIYHTSFGFTKDTALPLGCLEHALMFQNRPTDISYLDLANGTMYVEGEDITPGNINGAGFNKKDGYYWGFNHTIRNGTLSRVGKDANGNLDVDHFNIPNLTINSYTGDIDNHGHLYLKENGTSKVAVIDLDPNSDNYLTKLRNFNLDGTLNIADWAFNPQDDKLYAVGENKLYKIEPSNGNFLSIQDINLTGSAGYGASFFDKDGNYYIYRNNSGEIFRIDVDSENPQAVPFSIGGIVSSNDGAMCTDVEIRFDFGDLPEKYATTLEKDGARHRIKSSVGKILYLGDDVSTENNGKPSIDASADTSDDGVSIAGASLQGYTINSKLDIMKDMTITTHGNGYLNAWIDWNRDGDFNASEQIAQGIDGSSGTITLTLNADAIPNIYFNGKPLYARFRYSSEQDLNATGTAPDGEVEDYMMITPRYPNISIEDDISKVEGDSGEVTAFTFKIFIDQNNATLLNNTVLNYSVDEGTATLADNDYINHNLTGSIPFDPTMNSVNITVNVNGDNRVESDEKFYLNLLMSEGVNILDSRATGTIENDDSLILNIERTNSNTTDNDTQARKESLYTQIANRDFNYAIVAYDKNHDFYPIENMTLKVQLYDNNTTKEDNLLYEYYKKVDALGSRFDIINSNDLKIPIATRKARFVVHYLVDENSSLLLGQFDKNAYEALKEPEHNTTEESFWSDNFAIRPASYRITIEENNATNKNSDELNLVAGHSYNINLNATQYKSENVSKNYTQTLTQQIDTNLTFKGQSTCNNDSNKSLNYKFTDGTIDTINTTLFHNNYGKYTFSILDSNWTEVDMKNGDCILNNSNISTDANSKSGCNISSELDTDHHDINITFQPFEFDLNNTTLSNVHNNKSYLYMSDLNQSQKMGVKISSNIVARGEDDTQLTNFTKSCIEENENLTLKLNFVFEDDRGVWDDANMTLPESVSGKPLKPQQLVAYNDANLSESNITMIQNINIEKKNFQDDNNGSTKVDILYNMEKLFTQPTNPIKVDFLGLDLNTSGYRAKIQNREQTPSGEKALNRFKTFYFARIASYVKNYPETEKKRIKTPLFVELFCSTKTETQAWCRNTMDLKTVGKRIGQKTYAGWYLAKNHDSNTEGSVKRLVSLNPDISTNKTTTLPPFKKGKIKNIKTFYNKAGKLKESISAEIAIDTDVWLRFNKKAVTGMPTGTSSYCIKLKALSSITGVGETKNLIDTAKKVESNGKMSW